MTGSLPLDVQQVFDRFVTTEYVTIDRTGQPIVWPVTPYYSPGASHIDVTTRLGYPKKADDAQRNPRVALLFSDPTGSGLDGSPMVLVQGTAAVDDRDLEANRRRYEEESVAKIPAVSTMQPPSFVRRAMGWYFKRIYVHVRPERVYMWPDADPGVEPQLFDDHMEEVRSGHNEEPEESHARAEAGDRVWGPRLRELGTDYGGSAVLAVVCPDGFPFAVRVPVRADSDSRLVRIEADPVGAPLEPGRACLTAHVHAPDFAWQRNFQVRGDLVDTGDGWALSPHKIVGGLESPPGSRVEQLRRNARKAWRFSQTARREERRRT
jgi:pyridoxamine 5'-phosphate oxidase-like protein